MAKVHMDRPSASYFYPWPLVLVSCVSTDGKPNIITIGASSVCSSNPPTVGIAIKPARYSYGLIKASGDFGVNIPGPEQLEAADRCGWLSGAEVDKFAETGLTAQASRAITSPLVAECPVSLECRLIQTVPLGSHDWLIGEVVAAHVDEALLDEDGRFRPCSEQALFCFGGDYRRVGDQIAGWFFTR
ncbi:MAG TPA: flavin reductase family protein [Armatimonadetes bacterium]|nr:flavin reductase family protein [Armatimonadota bacterium]